MAGTARQQRADRGSAQPLAPPVPDHSHQRPFFARPARLSSLVVAAGLHKLWAQSRLALPAQAHSCAPFTHSVSKSGCQPGSFQASIGGSLLASSEDASANANFDDYISQGIAISLTYKTFLRIASGKKVQIRMGPREFELEVMKNKFVRAQVIIWYTLIDECLNVVKKWDQIEERLNAKVEGITDKSKSRIDAADTLADQTVKTLQSQNFYSYGWDALAKQLDSWVEKKVKSGRKRAFSNIIAIKSKNRAKHATAGAFSIAIIKDRK